MPAVTEVSLVKNVAVSEEYIYNLPWTNFGFQQALRDLIFL